MNSCSWLEEESLIWLSPIISLSSFEYLGGPFPANSKPSSSFSLNLSPNLPSNLPLNLLSNPEDLRSHFGQTAEARSLQADRTSSARRCGKGALLANSIHTYHRMFQFYCTLCESFSLSSSVVMALLNRVRQFKIIKMSAKWTAERGSKTEREREREREKGPVEEAWRFIWANEKDSELWMGGKALRARIRGH